MRSRRAVGRARLVGVSAHVKDLEGKGGWAEHSSRVSAVADLCGPTDFFKIFATDKAAARMLGGDPKDKAKIALASPITHITKDAPPFLVIHADNDKAVPFDQGKSFADALAKAGVAVTFYEAKGLGHGLAGPEVNRRIAEFFDGQLKKKPDAPAAPAPPPAADPPKEGGG